MLGVVTVSLLALVAEPSAVGPDEFSRAAAVEALRESIVEAVGEVQRVEVAAEREYEPFAAVVFDVPLLAWWPGPVHHDRGEAYLTVRVVVGRGTETSTHTVTAHAPAAVRLYAERRPLNGPASFASVRRLVAMMRASPPRPSPPPTNADVVDAVDIVVDDEAPSWIQTYLGPLGGVQLSLTGGVAGVESALRVPDGRSEVIGSGKATSSGYRVSFYEPPAESGLFYPPALGYFSQTITISGFREDLPAAPSIPGADTIAAVASDPADGIPIDLGEPIAYRLRLRSGYLGQTLGVHLVGDAGPLRLFATAQVALNVVEIRHTDVTIHVDRARGFSLAFFASSNAAAEVGIAIEDLHVAFVASGQFEFFRDFAYPEPLEFLAGARYDASKQIHERRRSYVKSALAYTLDWQLSAVILF